MSLRIFNTLSMQKEDFVPLAEGKVRMYVCGVTVYDYCHVGHARSAIVFDTLYRYLRHLGYEVTYARNFTDIDDKIIKRAAEENISWQAVTEKYIQAFHEDMGALNIATPTLEPKATDHIADMIQMVASLVDQGKAYESEGDVYYAIRSFADYGKLSRKKLDDLIAGARVEVGEQKRDPMDFALWKKSKPGEPSWDSPWGPGRPGWHIECSAMSYRYLGEVFDIHGGGKDLVFPHHENEIAQTCGHTGKPPVKYWVHNGFVNINKEKMSKSLGNFFTIRDILKQYHAEVLRLFLLTNHYRGPIDFADQYLHEARKVLDRFYEFFAAVEAELDERIPESKNGNRAHPLMKKFEEAMDDDFNSAVALAHLNEVLRHLNTALTEVKNNQGDRDALAADAAVLKYMGNLLGLFFDRAEAYQAKTLKLKAVDLDTVKIEGLIADRKAARAAKEWGKADQCRDALSEMGVILEDSAHGTTWKIK